MPKLPRMSEFAYQDPFPLGPDTTEYECLTTGHVSASEFEGKPVLKVAPEGLALLANEAMKAINFTLRPSHLAQVAAILDDPEATENDRMVALMLLKNAEIAAKGILPACQDTGTATVVGKKGQAKRLQSSLRLFAMKRRKWNIGGAFVYTWRDFAADQIACNWCPWAGLTNRKGKPKPALGAVKKILRKQG